MAGHPGPVAARGLAPLLAWVLLDEVAHAPWGVTGTQPGTVRSGEEADHGAGQGGGQCALALRCAGRVVGDEGVAFVRPVETGDGRDNCGRGIEPVECLGHGHQVAGIGGTGFTGAYGVREESPDGGTQGPYRGEALLVRLPDIGRRGVRRPDIGLRAGPEQTGPFVHPGGQPLGGAEVVGDTAPSVMADGECEVEREPGVGHKANGSVSHNH